MTPEESKNSEDLEELCLLEGLNIEDERQTKVDKQKKGNQGGKGVGKPDKAPPGKTKRKRGPRKKKNLQIVNHEKNTMTDVMARQIEAHASSMMGQNVYLAQTIKIVNIHKK